NDDCANATGLTIGTASSGTVWFATASSNIPVGCATGTPDDDVWYKFTATASKMTVSLSSIGTDLAASGTVMQFFSGACGTLNSIACAGTSTLYATGLTVGTTYYVRVYSSGTGILGSVAANSAFSITAAVPASLTSTSMESSRMSEVFQQTILSPANGLNDPWEITYGPDGNLWITEAKGYKLYRMDPANGVKVTVLDVSQNSTFLPATDRGFNVQFSTSQNPWPQGGFAGMAIHPKFLDPVSPKNYIYVSYVHSYVKTVTSPASGGIFFKNRVVRFTYNTSTGKLESPVSLCDTLPGSSDHNSQRMIIAPVNGTDYLFYASGDMGAGQYDNTYRANKAQITASYEGKILRFNL
ncbi:MAG TPA: PQQ-dependent sugar dehydrogenase, partial [Flavisolibacter sp.]|nr:PQQ-dependent sugar dehydrogenase [Flavisolibacter sp.]